MAVIDRRLAYHFDWTLFGLVAGLIVVGMLSIFSASYTGPHRPFHPLLIRQLSWIAAGLILMVAAVLLDYRALATYAYPLYGIALALLGALSVIGHSRMGARRWIDLGLFGLDLGDSQARDRAGDGPLSARGTSQGRHQAASVDHPGNPRDAPGWAGS